MGNGKDKGNGKVREQVRNVIVRKGKWKQERKLRLRKGEKREKTGLTGIKRVYVYRRKGKRKKGKQKKSGYRKEMR